MTDVSVTNSVAENNVTCCFDRNLNILEFTRGITCFKYDLRISLPLLVA